MERGQREVCMLEEGGRKAEEDSLRFCPIWRGKISGWLQGPWLGLEGMGEECGASG